MNDLAWIAIIAVGFSVLLGVRRRREQVRRNLRTMILAILAGLIVFGIAQSQRLTNDAAWLLAVGTGVVIWTSRPKRSRYIPARERRAAKARHELTGEKYNSKKHHFHHDVPFSRGGSNTEDNLRVISKGENLKRGAKSPWWDLLGRM